MTHFVGHFLCFVSVGKHFRETFRIKWDELEAAGIACVATVFVWIGSKKSPKMGRVKEQRGGSEVRKEKLADKFQRRISKTTHFGCHA